MYIETNLNVLQAFVAALFVLTGMGHFLLRLNRLRLVRVRRHSRDPEEHREFEN